MSSRFSSFKRQLSFYQFFRVSEGPDIGGYFHEYLLRGRPDLLLQIRRQPQLLFKGPRVKPPARTWSPNFNLFPPCRELTALEILQLCRHASDSNKVREQLMKPQNRRQAQSLPGSLFSGGQRNTSAPPINVAEAPPDAEELAPSRIFALPFTVATMGQFNAASGSFFIQFGDTDCRKGETNHF